MGYSTDDLTQTPLNAPTVFNFFYPDYQFPGAISAAGMTTPEFQLSNDTGTMTMNGIVPTPRGDIPMKMVFTHALTP